MRLLTTIFFLAATGCVENIGTDGPGGGGGDDGTDDPPPSGVTAKQMFKTDVYPAIGKCSGGGCHDLNATSAALGKFYTSAADTTYDATVVAPSIVSTFSSLAPILQHVKAGHKGVTYSADETTKITAWLAKETQERANPPPGGGPPPPPPFDAKALLKTWSGCMTQANFDAANMTQAWSTLAADNLQKCLNCHIGGAAGFYISNNATAFFSQISQNTAFLLKYFSVNTAEKKVVINTAAFESANKIQKHPTFPLTNAGMTALQKFYESTLAKQAAETCDPPRLLD
jgi:hypothetical protein